MFLPDGCEHRTWGAMSVQSLTRLATSDLSISSVLCLMQKDTWEGFRRSGGTRSLGMAPGRLALRRLCGSPGTVRCYSWGVRLPVRIPDAVRILHLAVEVSLDSLLKDGQVRSGTNAPWGACSCLNSLSDLWLILPLSFSPLLWTE